MKPQPVTAPLASPDDSPAQRLSDLADGWGSDGAAAEAACRHWRTDAEARRTWHAYHLIGDVLRSEDLATLPAGDAAFMAWIRERLASEPVVLAPHVPVRRQQPWLVPVAMAAGFVVVAGVLVLTRASQAPAPSDAGRELAAASSALPSRGVGPVPVMNVMTRPQALGVRPLVDDAGVLRDARLDEFLRAHQAVGPGMTMTVPGGTLRRVDIVAPADSGR